LFHKEKRNLLLKNRKLTNGCDYWDIAFKRGKVGAHPSEDPMRVAHPRCSEYPQAVHHTS
jgi:hypothetical protein